MTNIHHSEKPIWLAAVDNEIQTKNQSTPNLTGSSSKQKYNLIFLKQ